MHVICDLTIAKESAVFRQVGPMMGSFDAGYGTWYLEDVIGKKKAKEMWFRNIKLTAKEALDLGLVNKVVPDDALRDRIEHESQTCHANTVLISHAMGSFAMASDSTAILTADGFPDPEQEGGGPDQKISTSHLTLPLIQHYRPTFARNSENQFITTLIEAPGLRLIVPLLNSTLLSVSVPETV